jgi:hypothetical protein
MVTPIVPITTTPPPEGTPAPLIIPTILLRTTVPQPDTELSPEWLEAYKEEQQSRAHAQQEDTERRAAQRQGELAGEQATIVAQLTELHHIKSVLETEHAVMIDLTNTRAQARDVTATINCKGALCPAFTRASHNVVAMAMLLDTLPTTSANGKDNVYHQRKDILSIAAVQLLMFCMQLCMCMELSM